MRAPGRPGARSVPPQVRVLVGRAWGMESPVTPVSETLYLDISLPAGGRLDIPALAQERALYAVDGTYQLEGKRIAPYAMAVLPAGDTVRVEAETPARVMLIGGEPLDGPRFIWWNFVSSKRETIRVAAAEWSAHQTPRIEGETDWVPLPNLSLPL